MMKKVTTPLGISICSTLHSHPHMFPCQKTVKRNEAAIVPQQASTSLYKILKFFFFKIEYDLYFLDRFDMLISKIIFKKIKKYH
jgi:hypothetical protein